jgi:thiamine biosynthesis protein ThiS
MKITVNGEGREVDEGSTLRALLERLEVRLEAVAVEKNGALVRRRDLDATRLSEGDRVEVVTFVGGG